MALVKACTKKPEVQASVNTIALLLQDTILEHYVASYACVSSYLGTVQFFRVSPRTQSKELTKVAIRIQGLWQRPLPNMQRWRISTPKSW